MGAALNLLIVEDSELDCGLILHEFSEAGYTVLSERVYSPDSLKKAISGNVWDAVISDYLMPDFTGLDALKIIRESGKDLPFIIVSGAIGEAVAVQAMKAGAQDYIMKGSLSRLVPAVVREIHEAKVRSDGRRAEEEAKQIQASLIHVNKMTSLGTLAAGIAHEINNPNNFILLNSALLSDAWQDGAAIFEAHYREHGDFLLAGIPYSEMRERLPAALGGITEGARRIKGIVDDLKHFARTEPAGYSERYDVNKAVTKAVVMLGAQIKAHTDNFKLSLAEGLPSVKGSSQKLEQVVINLILNALQSLSSKGSSVSVETSFDAATGDAVIRVADNGAGIPKEILSRVTEPFFTTRAATGGTGLGLFISYSIVKEQGGTLTFESDAGKGTTVIIRLR